jgi:hypothetical protein
VATHHATSRVEKIEKERESMEEKEAGKRRRTAPG